MDPNLADKLGRFPDSYLSVAGGWNKGLVFINGYNIVRLLPALHVQRCRRVRLREPVRQLPVSSLCTRPMYNERNGPPTYVLLIRLGCAGRAGPVLAGVGAPGDAVRAGAAAARVRQ